MQSGRGNLRHWLLEYELETPRRPEPLMGWVSSGDTLNQVRLRFASEEEAVALVVNGFVRDVLQQLPMEFMAETQKLIGISLEGSVG